MNGRPQPRLPSGVSTNLSPVGLVSLKGYRGTSVRGRLSSRIGYAMQICFLCLQVSSGVISPMAVLESGSGCKSQVWSAVLCKVLALPSPVKMVNQRDSQESTEEKDSWESRVMSGLSILCREDYWGTYLQVSFPEHFIPLRSGTYRHFFGKISKLILALHLRELGNKATEIPTVFLIQCWSMIQY